MKKVLLFFIILLTGCSFINQKGSNIETPELNTSPLLGKWTITKYIYSENLDEDNFSYKDLIGTDVIFSNSKALVGNNILEKPKYKIKNINIKKYLYEKYNVDNAQVGFENEDVHAIDISDSNNIYYEIIRDTEDIAYIFTNGVIFQITKSKGDIPSEELDEIINEKKANLKYSEPKKHLENEYGLLLGLKTEQSQMDIPSYVYKTIYIKFSNNNVENIYEIPNILFPRRDGFAEAEVRRESKSSVISDKVILKYAKENEKRIDGLEIEEDNILRNINYITDKYISFENLDLDKNIKKLRIYDISSLEEKNVLSINDFLINKKDREKYEEELKDLKSDYKNIGIYRDNGYWKIKGRQNFANSNKYQDFDIFLKVPNVINAYNKLGIAFTDLKNFHSSIRDAYITPNNKFLITLENNLIRVYNINDKIIEKTPIMEKEIDQKTSVIMSEWAVGSHAKKWQMDISRKK